MAFRLADLKADVEKNYGPWEVEWGDEGDERTVKFNHLLMGDAEGRTEFYRLVAGVGVLSRPDVSEEDQLQVLAYLGLDPEDVDADPFPAVVEKIKATMRALATRKQDFDRFARAAGNDLPLWIEFLTAYNNHFEVEPGESTPSQTS